MAFRITTDIDIKAKPSDVWSALLAFETYPTWKPFILSLTGRRIVGETLTALILPPGGSKMKFTPTVLVAKENEELRWRGKLFVPGLFDGEHSFSIRALDANTVKFVHEERFSGLLVPLFKKVLARTEAGFHLMNSALKKRLEK